MPIDPKADPRKKVPKKWALPKNLQVLPGEFNAYAKVPSKIALQAKLKSLRNLNSEKSKAIQNFFKSNSVGSYASMSAKLKKAGQLGKFKGKDLSHDFEKALKESFKEASQEYNRNIDEFIKGKEIAERRNLAVLKQIDPTAGNIRQGKTDLGLMGSQNQRAATPSKASPPNQFISKPSSSGRFAGGLTNSGPATRGASANKFQTGFILNNSGTGLKKPLNR